MAPPSAGASLVDGVLPAGDAAPPPARASARKMRLSLFTLHSSFFTLVLVLALAALFRLGALDLASFQYDEADALLRARAVAQGQLALTGAQTSWGVPDPPFQVYLLAPA